MNYFKEIDAHCKSGLQEREGSEYSILRHLFAILGEEDTNKWLGGLIDYCLSKGFSEDDFFCKFHKDLRQTDVFNDGHLDMIFYNFIYTSRIPYLVIGGIYEEQEHEYKRKVTS